MNGGQRAAIQHAYLDGLALDEIAEHAGVTVAEAEIYLHWWCDRACPGAKVAKVVSGE